MISEKNKETSPLIVAIHYQYFKNISSLTKEGSTNKYLITFVGDEVWKPIYFTPASAKFSQKAKQTNAGTQYTQQLNFNVPGENADDQDELAKMNNIKVVCRIEYSDGTLKLTGSDKIPAYLSEDFNSDDKATLSSWKAVSVTNKRAYFLAQ